MLLYIENSDTIDKLLSDMLVTEEKKYGDTQIILPYIRFDFVPFFFL